jgi:hypothetical protein
MFDEDESSDREEAERLRIERRKDDVCWLMSDVRGRRYVWGLLTKTRFETRSTLFDTHGGRQSYLLGAYEVGRTESDEIRALCPEEYLAMVRENTQQTDEVTQ